MSAESDIEQRLRRLEDTVAIHDLMVAYGLAADAGDHATLRNMFTDDAVYELEGLRLEGPDAIVTAVMHRSSSPEILATAHNMGPAIVRVLDDRAVAHGYSRLYVLAEDGTVSLWRLSFNRWDFVRTSTGWKISRRLTRALGAPHATAILHRDLDDRGGSWPVRKTL